MAKWKWPLKGDLKNEKNFTTAPNHLWVKILQKVKLYSCSRFLKIEYQKSENDVKSEKYDKTVEFGISER